MTDSESTHDPADATPLDENLKNQTMRISLEDARPIKSPLEAKKATGLMPNIPAHAAPIPQTIRLKRPPTSPITLQPIDKRPGDTAFVQAPTIGRTAETAKRQTSRIGLTDSTTPKSNMDINRTTGPIFGIPMHAGPIPQTIRLKRPPTSPIITKISEPAVVPNVEQAAVGGQDITEAPTVIKHVAVPKTPTSRIVLDDSPAPVSTTTKQSTTQMPAITSAASSAPKTIRLKRPSTLSDAEEAATEGSLKAAKKGETSKIDLPIEDSALTPMTQRKTIKIKRTDRTVAPRQSAVTPETDTVPHPGTIAETPVPEAEEAIVFPIVALAATFCIATLVYIMVAQAFGVHLFLPASMHLH